MKSNLQNAKIEGGKIKSNRTETEQKLRKPQIRRVLHHNYSFNDLSDFPLLMVVDYPGKTRMELTKIYS